MINAKINEKRIKGIISGFFSAKYGKNSTKGENHKKRDR
jgi:hypothetical protein